jgi:AAA domain
MFRCVAAIPQIGGNCIEHFYPDTPEGHTKAEEFVRQYDRDGWGVYNCVSTLKNKRRAKDSVAQIAGLHIDIDTYKNSLSKEEVVEKLRGQLVPFGILSWLNDSGRGVHGYFMFREPIEAGSPEAEEAERVLKRLITHLGADPAPSHFAALMRRAGTTNRREGGGPCKTLLDTGARCELSDIATYLDLVEGKELFPARPTTANDSTAEQDVSSESNGPIDVNERLATMRFGGKGKSGIHWTQLQTTASLINSGKSVEDAAAIVLAATRAAVANDRNCAGWNWAKEEFEIRRMCYDLISKSMHENGEDLGSALPADLQSGWEAALAAGKRPFVSRNGSGFHVRSYPWDRHRGTDPVGEPAHKDTPQGNTTKDSAAPREQPSYRFTLTPFSAMRPGQEQLYLIDELIPVKGLVDIWGKAKCFKSFVTHDMMLHIAMGWEYRDRSVRQGAVLYCAFEGGHGYKKRCEALRRHYQIDDDTHVPLYTMPGHANLIKEHTRLIADVKAQLGEVKPIAVVLDTLNKSFMGSESKDQDMGDYVRAAEAIRDAFDCVVVIVHHCGLDETRPRGHTSLPGAVDAQLAVVREGWHSTVTVEMMRDGPEDTVVTSVLESIDVGEDEAGKTLTSLIVLPAETPVEAPKNKWRGALLGLFRQALCEALLNSQRTTTVGGDQIHVADLETVRAEFYRTYVAKGDTAEQKQNARRMAFYRCVEKAQSFHLIGTRVLTDDTTLVWLAVGDAHGTGGATHTHDL